MARRERSSASDTAVNQEADSTTLPEEATSMTETATEEVIPENPPTADEAPASTEAPAAPVEKQEEAPIDLTGFQAAVETAIGEADPTTGVLPEAAFPPVTSAYRDLGGSKAKSAARKLVNEMLKDSMAEGSLPKARACMSISEALTSAPSGGTREPRTPADPTEAFVQRLAALQLATALAASNKPEAVADDYTSKVDALVSESEGPAKSYLDWLNRTPVTEGETDAPEPEVSNFVKAAVKLSVGRSAKVGGSTSTKSGTSTPYTGERRDIGKHIQEAFADQPSGAFLTVAEIRKFASSEYSVDSPPSAGAISARLFPQSGKCTVEGIRPGTNADGNRGATKVA